MCRLIEGVLKSFGFQKVITTTIVIVTTIITNIVATTLTNIITIINTIATITITITIISRESNFNVPATPGSLRDTFLWPLKKER